MTNCDLDKRLAKELAKKSDRMFRRAYRRFAWAIWWEKIKKFLTGKK